MKKIIFILVCLYFATGALAADTGKSNLENLALAPESFWNGSELDGSYEAVDTFTSGSVTLINYYSYDAGFLFNSWGGFAYSNITDTLTGGLDGQYNAITGKGEGDSQNYVVGYYNTYAQGLPVATFEAPQVVSGAYFTNNNYAYYSMLNGDGFAKKFEAGDWFKLTITGKDINGGDTGTVEFLLADGADIVDTWTWVDLNPLGEVKSLEFSLTSSDSDPVFGMNTPAYFCMDTIDGEADFENLQLAVDSYKNGSDLLGSYTATDTFVSGISTYNNLFSYDALYQYSSWEGFAYSNITDTITEGLDGQYMAIPGSGAKNSDTYAIAYCGSASIPPTATLDVEKVVSGMYITNTNYAYYSMLNGDGFAKKFEAGDEFKLTITGKDESNQETGTVEFLLADGTDIVNTWTWVDLSALGTVKSLEFALSSTDNGAFGMNTPAYFAMDSINDPVDNDDKGNDNDNGGNCFIQSLSR